MTAVVKEKVDRPDFGAETPPELRVALASDMDLEPVLFPALGPGVQLDADDPRPLAEELAPHEQRSAIENPDLDEGDRPVSVGPEELIVDREVGRMLVTAVGTALKEPERGEA